MAEAKGLVRGLIQRFLEWAYADNPPDGYQIQPPGDIGRVHDGVLYALPPVMPEVIRSADPATQSAFAEATDPFRSHFGTPYASGSPFTQLNYSDPLAEWDWITRRYILEQCHLAWERNPLAHAGVSYIRMFAVQNGFSMTYSNEQVEEVLEAFIDENGIRDYDKTLLDSLIIDGEIFLRFFSADGGEGGVGMRVSPLPPWGIQYIQCNPNDLKDVVLYHYVITLSDGAMERKAESIDIPADDVLHVAINRLPYEQRGRPDLFRVLAWLGGYKEFLENRARLNAFSGVVYHVKAATNNAGHIAAIANRWKKPMMPGSVVVTSNLEEIIPLPHNIAAMDSAEDGRQFKLMIAAGLGLPEYFLSDGSNANLASATAQQLPALRKFGEYQDIMRDQLWLPVFKRVIEQAVEAGILPEEVEEQRADGTPIEGKEGETAEKIKAVDAFDLQYPELESDDPAALLNALMTAVNAGLMSEQTATSLLPWPINYDQEQERIDAEREKQMDAMARGLIPTPPTFGQAQPAGVQYGPGAEPEDEEPESEDDNE